MKLKDDFWTGFVMCLIICGILWSTSLIACREILTNRFRTEAVSRGYAEWRINENIQVEFVWKNKEETNVK